MPDEARRYAEIKARAARRPGGQFVGWSQAELDRADLLDIVARMRPYVKDHRLCLLDYAGIDHGKGKESAATKQIDELLEETR